MSTKNPQLNECLETLMPPAENWRESSRQLTTDEIFNAMEDHCPGPYDKEDVYNALVTAKYKRDILATGQAVWLIK
ncbi:MAG TPA: hypothetical protein VEA37_10790 [Flavobacterium sp.]|nr:hypothetical protein [Flavobacterium sp.]